MSPQNGSWEKLGRLLAGRRTEIDPRWFNRRVFASETGLNWRLLYDVERARRADFRPETLAAFEVAYRLAPGSIGRTLAGGDLERADPPPQRLAAVRDLPARSSGSDDDTELLGLAVKVALGMASGEDEKAVRAISRIKSASPRDRALVILHLLADRIADAGTGQQRRSAGGP